MGEQNLKLFSMKWFNPKKLVFYLCSFFSKQKHTVLYFIKVHKTNKKIQNSKLKTQNSKLKTQNSKLKTQNTKHKTQNTKHKTQNTKHKTQNTKFDLHSVASQIPPEAI
jgi:hypothetical protein